MRNTKNLKKILSNHFIKFSLIPIFVVEIAGIILYFSINSYVSSNNSEFLLKEAQFHSQSILKDEAVMINDKLVEISRMASILQDTHENIMSNPEQFQLSNFNVNFGIASNGVFYKTSEIGSSLYYSSETKITDIERKKAIITEAMDTSLKSVVDTNPYVGAAYFNTWDNMNRLYPFIDKVYDQYGKHIQMEDYNFYYLADKKHNPEKKPVWTSAYLDPAGNGWMMSCVVPIYNNDFLEGVTGLDITIDNFVNNILNKKLSYDANLFMIDKDGMIIAMPEKIESLLGLKELKEHLYTDSILKTISKPEEYNVLTNKSPFAAHFKNLIENKGDYSVLKIKDKEYLTLQQNIDETNWKLIILIDKDNIYSSIENLKSLSDKVGYIAIIFLVFFYVLFFTFLLRRINVFSNSITEPIIDLSKQTSEISIRKTDVRIINTNILEIHQLSSNFVSMINELNERNKKLHKAKRKAIEANKIKSEFLANMSHEIRTPLNGIIGLTELVLQSELNEIQKDYLLKSQQSSKSLLHIINDILDYSKIEAGKLDIVKERFSLNELMKNISYLFSYMIYDKDLEFNFTIDKDINKILIGDSLRITQVLNNFVGNAIKFTSKGFIRIDVTLISKTDKLMHLRFSVVDSGIGIAKENQSKLFQAFNQEDSSTTKKFGGTGLGLSISKQLIDLMDAKLIFESQKDLGSTFGFEIALEYDTNALDVPKHHENLKDQKFLIIDDNEIDREYLYNLLNSWDIEALKAKDGLEAYDILKSKEIDYILVDWMMPELDGLELLQKLQYDNIKVPNILMITAYNKNELLQKAKQNNISINKVLEKPYTPSSLYNVLFDNVKDILNSSDEIDIKLIKKQKALLVEDNEINQIVASKMLKNIGFEVDIANDGLEAVDMAKKSRYAIVFMDLQMPNMDGFEATEKIREFDKETPIIALSAAVMQKDKELTSKAGMNDHLTKPIIKKQLENTISKYLETKKENTLQKSHQKNLPTLEGIDLDKVVENFGGDIQAALLLYEKFVKNYQNIDKDIKNLQDDSKEFEQYIHKLKGVSGNLQINNLFYLVKQIHDEHNYGFRDELIKNTQDMCEKIKTTLLPWVDSKQIDTQELKDLIVSNLKDLENYEHIKISTVSKLINRLKDIIDQDQIDILQKGFDESDNDLLIEHLSGVLENL